MGSLSTHGIKIKGQAAYDGVNYFADLANTRCTTLSSLFMGEI